MKREKNHTIQSTETRNSYHESENGASDRAKESTAKIKRNGVAQTNSSLANVSIIPKNDDIHTPNIPYPKQRNMQY
jgi:hypothetical protein